MSANHLEQDSKSLDYDLYTAVILSGILDDKENKKTNLALQTTLEQNEDNQLNDAIMNNVLWVPADKHPQIAPNEFAKFIKTYDMTTPARRAVSLDRKRSILSRSYSKDDEDLNRTLSEKKRIFLKKMLEEENVLKKDSEKFDCTSTEFDTSQTIVPQSDKPLLRRSALSARGPNRKSYNNLSYRRSTTKSNAENKHDTGSMEPNHVWDKSKGVTLFDRPVNMSEWIDLGSASLDTDDSQRGILLRVQDAESQLHTQLNFDDLQDTNLESKEAEIQFEETKDHNQTNSIQENKTPTPETQPMKSTSTKTTNSSVSSQKSSDSKGVVKRQSWISDLFNINSKHKKTNNLNVSLVQSTVKNHNNSSLPLSGLTSLFNRSLSLKYTSKQNKVSATSQKSQAPKPIDTTIKTNNKPKKSQLNGLELTISSDAAFFNTSRLPIHVERAIYRLSHIKLTNPRRPLKQQVMISNFMFWYLSIQQCDSQRSVEQKNDSHGEQKKNKKSKNYFFSLGKKNKERLMHNYSAPLPQETIQFNHIPNRYPAIVNKSNYGQDMVDNEDDEDNLPLSYYRN